MSGDIPITKDEFKIALEVQAKATEQMVLIASALKEITVELKEVHERLTNGAITDIVDGVCHNYNSVHKETIHSLDIIRKNQEQIIATQNSITPAVKEVISNSDISKDIRHSKWFIAIIGTIIIITTIILRIVGFDASSLKTQEKVIQHLLEQHIEQTAITK